MKIVHLTDTHLCDPGVSLFDADPTARLRACVDEINEYHSDAQLCVLTGDLVHDGGRRAYASLGEELARLRVPHRLLLGNHDDRDNFKACFPEAQSDSHGFVQSHVDLDEGRVLLLDTLQRDRHEGWLCEARLAWLQQQVAESRDRALFIAMHHPPMKVGHPALDRMVLVQRQAFEAIIRQATHLRHVFFGHVHRPISGRWCNVSFSALNGTTGLSRMQFSDTARPMRNLPPPAFSTALITDAEIIVHTHTVGDPSPRFTYDNDVGGEPRLTRVR